MKQLPSFLATFASVLLCCTAVMAQKAEEKQPPALKFATGRVFDDASGNEKFDEGEKPLAGVRVSNGRAIVATDEAGRYRIPVDDDTIIFVIKPRGWRTPMTKTHLPRFYYIHKPNGSPKAEFAGVPPTGPLPDSIDFPLYPQTEPDKFKAIILGDTQTTGQKEIGYLCHDILEELVGTDAAIGFTLGDIVNNNLASFEPITEAVSIVGVPWYNVIGNHDTNFDAKMAPLSDESFERVFGPSCYSFDYGLVHFILLDDFGVSPDPQTGEAKWRAGIGEKQLKFLKNDLAGVPEEKLVVLMMHIPIVSVHDRESVYRLIENRPHCISLSGHTHSHEHRFLEQKDGWNGAQPHHHIIHGTACGCWWHGCFDDRGIPNATMGDGVPNGYSIITFDGNKYTQDYKVAGRGADYQMLIHAPESVPATDAATTKILANVFNSSPRSTVKMRVDGGEWIAMTRERLLDPVHCQLREIDEKLKDKPWESLTNTFPSTHLWTALLPAGLAEGVHLIQVETIDMNGKKFSGNRILRIAAKE
jgi:hypothetical protein